MTLRVLLVGRGAIARYIVNKFAGDSNVSVTGILCSETAIDDARSDFGSDIQIGGTPDAITSAYDIAVECTGHHGLAKFGPPLLAAGTDVISVSVGALSDQGVAEELENSAVAGGASIEIVSGAIGGIDCLAAARIEGLDDVVCTSTKPPGAWFGTPAEMYLDLENLTSPAQHFQGSAREAARQFPKNANIAATVALAGIGLDRTNTHLVADPHLLVNKHVIQATGAFGRMRFEIEGNPLGHSHRTSALAAMSLVRAVKNRIAPLRI